MKLRVMRGRPFLGYFAALLATASAVVGLAVAQSAGSLKSETPIQLSIGESLQAVQAALNASVALTSTPTATGAPEMQMRLSERGIWVFVGPDNRALQYRFDAPFAGSIHGAKIGASIGQTQAALGTPAKALPHVIHGRSFLYREDDGVIVRCDFDERGMLRTIRVLGGSIGFTSRRLRPIRGACLVGRSRPS